MDKYEALKGCILDFKQHLEEVIEKAENTRYAGYRDAIRTTRFKLGVVDYFIKKIEEFEANE